MSTKATIAPKVFKNLNNIIGIIDVATYTVKQISISKINDLKVIEGYSCLRTFIG